MNCNLSLGANFLQLDRLWAAARINVVCHDFSVKVRDVIKLLRKDGWCLVRTRGSHRQFHHPLKPGSVTVAGHPGTDIPTGTLRNILKQAGLK